MGSLSKAKKAGFDEDGEVVKVLKGQAAEDEKKGRKKIMYKHRAAPPLL